MRSNIQSHHTTIRDRTRIIFINFISRIKVMPELLGQWGKSGEKHRIQRSCWRVRVLETRSVKKMNENQLNSSFAFNLRKLVMELI